MWSQTSFLIASLGALPRISSLSFSMWTFFQTTPRDLPCSMAESYFAFNWSRLAMATSSYLCEVSLLHGGRQGSLVDFHDLDGLLHDVVVRVVVARLQDQPHHVRFGALLLGQALRRELPLL